MKNVNLYNLGIKYYFSLGLLLMPFIYSPRALIPFEIPRVWWYWRWTEIWLLLVLVGLPWRWRWIQVNNRILIWLAACGVCVLTAIAGSDWPKSVWGNYYRMDGLLTLFHSVGLAVGMALVWERDWRQFLIKPLCWGALGLTIWTWAEAARNSWGQAIGVSFGQPNFLGGYLAVVFPFYWYWGRKLRGKVKLLWLTGMGAVIGAIGLSQSKGGVLAVAIWGLWVGFNRARNKAVKLMAVGAALILTAGVIWLTYNPSQPFVAESRLRIGQRLIRGIITKPLLGWGISNIDHAVESVIWPYPVLYDVYVDKAHNLTGEIIGTTGMVGLIIFLGLVVQVFISLGIKDPKSRKLLTFNGLLMSVMVTYLIHTQTNIISINEEMIFWLIVGIAGSNWGIITNHGRQ